jgi:hypothetical protein
MYMLYTLFGEVATGMKEIHDEECHGLWELGFYLTTNAAHHMIYICPECLSTITFQTSFKEYETYTHEFTFMVENA